MSVIVYASDVELEHISFGVAALKPAALQLAECVGNNMVLEAVFRNGPFHGTQMFLPDTLGGMVELLTPAGKPAFLHRFLKQSKPYPTFIPELCSLGADIPAARRSGLAGAHHLTFVVPCLDAAQDRAASLDLRCVGRRNGPTWSEVFIHPRSSRLGIVIQMAKRGAASAAHAVHRVRRKPLFEPNSLAPPVTTSREEQAVLVGLELVSSDLERVRRIFLDVLLGVEHVEVPHRTSVGGHSMAQPISRFTWSGSNMWIRVRTGQWDGLAVLVMRNGPSQATFLDHVGAWLRSESKLDKTTMNARPHL